MNRVGHKRGREGVNAPKKCRMQSDNERYNNINDDKSVHLKETTTSIEHRVEDREVNNRGIDPTPTSWYPNFDLTPNWSQPRDNLLMFILHQCLRIILQICCLMNLDY